MYREICEKYYNQSIDYSKILIDNIIDMFNIIKKAICNTMDIKVYYQSMMFYDSSSIYDFESFIKTVNCNETHTDVDTVEYIICISSKESDLFYNKLRKILLSLGMSKSSIDINSDNNCITIKCHYLTDELDMFLKLETDLLQDILFLQS